MEINTTNHKEEEISSTGDFEKSELMQLFEFEIRNPFQAQMDLINAILETE